MRRRMRAACAAIAMFALAAAPAAGEEGMWTFDNFPTERMRREMGWAPDQGWLDRVMAGSARLPGCSGANVSAAGLILTNHHCVIACIAAISSGGADYLETGFMARARAQERRCPGLAVELLTGVADVTERINMAAAEGPPELFARLRDAEISRIESECARRTERCDVVTLYEGGRYGLYRYRRYEDVRLVFAPERAMAAFGGAADNFNFPRHCIDFAFLRLYEDGAPARTPRHLAMRFTPLQEGEIVLVSGSPGRTSRSRTTAELAFERDVALPARIDALEQALARLREHAALAPERARAVSGVLLTLENSLRETAGRRQALADESGFARVAAREADLQTRVRRNRAAAREVGDAWGEIARALAAYRGFFDRHQLLEQRAGERSLLFHWARDIVRGAAERQKPDADRLAGYAAARLGQVRAGLQNPSPVPAELEALHLSTWLAQLRARLDAATVRRLMGETDVEALARGLAASQLADRAYRVALWDGGAQAVAASDDPLIVFVRGWDDLARAERARYVAEVERPLALARERIARARFRAFGDREYPEATLSPRLSYGRVIGWSEADGRTVSALTTAGELLDRASGAPPLALSAPWLAARGRLDRATVFNVATSNDVIAGNSGSPLLDRDGAVAGVAFDGNVHSLAGEYYYDGALNRAVSVAAPAIRLALADVYDMDALVAELERRRR